MAGYHLSDDAPESLHAFAATLSRRDEATIAAYISTLRDLVAWLVTYPDGSPFRPDVLTVTALQAYFDHLTAAGRAPRTRARALTAISRFCKWAIDTGQMSRNPAHQIERPTVPSISPIELSPDQRIILKTLVERQESRRLSAIFALGYWAGMRISEVATLQVAQCDLNQRSGAITIVGAKGGKTRTIDLHNEARKALYAYLNQPTSDTDAREPDSCFVFTSQRAGSLRRRNQPDHLSTRGIEHQWAQIKAQASHTSWPIIKAITFHALRHDFAHRARAVGWTLEAIAVYLGHQTKDGAPAIMTTVRYTAPTRFQLREQLKTLPG
ncbi:MAG: tyrosine-type recombinase/integrase [Chloroflexales bacterium]